MTAHYLYNKTHWHPFTIFGRDDWKNSNKSADINADFSERYERYSSESCEAVAPIIPLELLIFLSKTCSKFSLKISTVSSVLLSVLQSSPQSNCLFFHMKPLDFHLDGNERDGNNLLPCGQVGEFGLCTSTPELLWRRDEMYEVDFLGWVDSSEEKYTACMMWNVYPVWLNKRLQNKDTKICKCDGTEIISGLCFVLESEFLLSKQQSNFKNRVL